MMDVLFLLGLYWLAASLAGASPNSILSDTRLVLPFEVMEGESTAEVVSVDGGLDLPKLTPGVNRTTFDWWYFDVVSSTTTESFTIIFENFEDPNLGGALSVQISGMYLDGTTFFKTMPATRNASFVANDKGIASHWDGEGGDFSFSGTNLDAPNITYTISGDDPDTESFGTVTLKSVSPPRYPCDPNIAGATEEIMPDVYSSSAVPDSDATVSLIIGGEAFNFEGYGYHDKRWGVNRLEQPVKSYYWGHGRLGPYSIVWLDALSKDGTEHFSSWISLNGTVAFQSCEDKSVVVRPWMRNGTDPGYPPKPRDPAPDGYDIRFDVDEGQAFVARFYVSAIQLSTDFYKRITGPIVGGFEGGEKYEGVALGEQAQNY